MIESFLQYIRYEKNYSSHTVLSYKTDIEQFRDFIITQSGSFEPQKITADDIREWIIALMDIGERPSSVNRKISALKSFYRYLKVNSLITSNPTQKVILPKKPKPLPVFFQEKEMDKCLEISKKDTTFEGVRNSLIVEIIYQTGLRRSEAATLRDKDVDTKECTLKILGKGNKERVVPFGNNLADKIDRYRQIRQETITAEPETLFVDKKGEPLNAHKIYYNVKKLMSEVTSQQKKSPHVLRHTFATTLLNDGADINSIQKLLGHETLAATEVYTHSTFEQIKNIYQQAHPRGKK